MPQEITRRERIDHDLLRRFHEHGDLQAREELAERCVPLVRSVARRYANRGQDTEDLIQVGMLGLAKAINRFDASSGHRFITFAVPNIQGEIRRHFRDCTWAVHVPRSVQELGARVQGTRTALVDATGREPTAAELATVLELPVAQVRDAQAGSRSYGAFSLDQPGPDGRTLGDGRGTVDGGYDDVDDRSVTDGALGVLDARERQIVTWRFRDELLQREIAERIGVSQMQVSRILKRALVRMHEHAADGASELLAA